MSFYEYPHTRTYDTDLGWIIKHVHTLEELVEALNKWVSETQPTINQIQDFFDDMNRGIIPDAFKDAIYQWATINLLPIVARTLKTVIFGLTDDGHFVATFYDSWRDITFNTTEYDIWLEQQPQFGHLTLSV